jgi:hypothetical protein
MDINDDGGPWHPFAITTKLPDDFGYSGEFINGELLWDSSATSGGGRGKPAEVLELIAHLADLTRSGKPLEERQEVLASLFHKHYGGGNIAFLVKLFCSASEEKTSSLNKSAGVDLLVKHGVPFIPFPVLNDHLMRGLTKYGGKSNFPSINLLGSYERFCENVPFPPSPRPADANRNSEKLAVALSYWEKAMETHNVVLPKNKRLSLSDEEINKLSGSQFSNSKGGTPHLRDGALNDETALREKLLSAQIAAQKRKLMEYEAEDLERKAIDLRESLSVNHGGSVSSKRKNSGDDGLNQGPHALDMFLSACYHKVNNADYIDFATMSSSRLREIKMLNTASSKTTRITANLVMRQCASEADVAILSDDLKQIQDGFLYHYLKMVSESSLPDPMKTIMDRLSWWQWVEANFLRQPAAQVKFIKCFLVDHHAVPFWTPIVKYETTLVLLCKQECTLPAQADARHSKQKGTSGPVVKTIVKKSGLAGASALTPAQRTKLNGWKSRFPSICLSRLVRGKNCRFEDNGSICRYTHACAWCGAATCKAMCNQAELL